MRGRSADLQMEGAALAGAGQRDRPRKGGKRTKASKAQELFEEEVKRLVKLVDVKLSLKSLSVKLLSFRRAEFIEGNTECQAGPQLSVVLDSAE